MTDLAVSRDGARIALHQLGDIGGAPVLMVHGFASNAQRNWIDTGWGAALQREGLRGIALDLRGHGDSDRKPGGYALARFIEDIDAVFELLELTELPGAIGYSMGSRLLWRYSLERQSAFRALVLGGMPSADPPEPFDADRALAAPAGEADAGSVEALVARLASTFPEHDPATLLRLFGEISVTPFRAADAQPAVPTLLLAGTGDGLATDSEAVAALMPRGSFIPIPDKHHFNAPVSRVFRDEATRFLASYVNAAP